VNSAPLAAAQ